MVVKSTQVKSLIFSLSLTLVLICSILSVRNAESSPSQLTVRENYRRWVEGMKFCQDVMYIHGSGSIFLVVAVVARGYCE